MLTVHNTKINLITDPTLEVLLQNAQEYEESELAESTKTAYITDCKVFAEWCLKHHFSALPASWETFRLFITEQADLGMRPNTLNRRRAAIKYLHELADRESPTVGAKADRLFKGIRRRIGAHVEQHEAITSTRLQTILKHIPDGLAGDRDRALLILGFAAALRRSELVALEVKDFKYNEWGMFVHVMRSKGDQEAVGVDIPVPNGKQFKVVEVLKNWLEKAAITEGAVFRRMRRGNTLQDVALTNQSVRLIVKKYANLAGFNVDEFSAHSLRSGFITSAAAAGATIFKIMDVSRHKTPSTVLTYIRKYELFKNHAGESFM